MQNKKGSDMGANWLKFDENDTPIRKFVFICVWSVLTLLVIASVLQGVSNGFRLIDFQWKPIRLMMIGENPYLYSINKVPFLGGVVDANQVPSCLLLLAPFAFLSYQTATIIWAFCNLVFTFLFMIFLYRLFKWKGCSSQVFIFLSVVLLLSTPWRVLIGNGQHLLFSLAFFVGSCFYASKGRYIISGLFLAISAFKYTTIAPMAFLFLTQKWWRSIIVAIFLHLIATLWSGYYLHESPITLVLQSLQVGSMLLGQGDADMLSLLVSYGVKIQPIFSLINYLFFAVLLMVFSFIGSKNDILLKLSLFATISSIMFYHRIYDFVILIFPLILICRDWDSEYLIDKVIRIVTIANLVLVFYGFRILQLGVMVPRCCYNTIMFILTTLLLTALLFKDQNRFLLLRCRIK